ncbi:hypothetical protein [Brachybacterium sp. UNK5269]|uniref:hypothetical protein n=1 Tax=Brachybacterium sp. UNK5269 TaxID=3408576 RepID=UPI003BB1D131
MNTNPQQDALRSRWTLESRIPLSGVADGAVWRRARSVATGEPVVLFIVQGEAALEAADAVRRAYLVEDPHLLPVQEIVVLDDPRDASDQPPSATAADGPTTVVEYPVPSAPPLAALLADGPLHPETARAVIGEAATGLEVARRRGVRHQLLDSNRIFVDTGSGAVMILGIGVEAAAHVGLDRSREVASFQDTAALVALLYRALTGRSPQPDAAGAVPRPSSVVDTGIPEDLDVLCDLVLNESADEIPETTRALIEALGPWQSIPVTLEAYPRAAPEPTQPPAQVEEDAALESTAAMDAVPDAEPEQEPGADDATARLYAVPAAAAAGDVPAATGAAGSGGTSGLAGAAGATAEAYGYDVEGERSSATDPAADDTAVPSAPAASAEAEELVKDLRLDQKRGAAAFPGHLEIARPVDPAPQEPSADAADGAAGAVAAGAAADLPAGTAGTLWPVASSAEHTEQNPLAPAPSSEGSEGRAEQPAASSFASTPDASPATPTGAVPQETDRETPTPVAVSGRTVPLAPVAADGPIVVHGRDHSLLDDTPPEESEPSARSSLLRDVVGVAVGADDPDTYAMGPSDREKRSLQSQWIILGGVIVVMGALVFAVTAVTSDLRDIMADPLATSEPSPTAPAEEDTGEAPSEPTAEPTEEPALPAPALGGVELFTAGTDKEPDNADQLDRMTDGDPTTYWSSQYYASPDYGGLKDGVGVRLNFAEPSTLTAVTVTTARNNGGAIELRALNDDGSLGDVLATGELAGDGQVRLEPGEPVDADKAALWIPELPPDSNESGRFRARIAEIQVE